MAKRKSVITKALEMEQLYESARTTPAAATPPAPVKPKTPAATPPEAPPTPASTAKPTGNPRNDLSI